MRTITAHEFPQEIAYVYARARRLEWIAVGYIASSTAFLFFVMGSSQAMRTSFFEDAVSIVPAVAFLVCTRLARRAPTDNFPYGLHRATSIGHLIAALALSTMGLFLLIEGGLKLISQEKATIGTVTFLGHSIWAGWPMLIALLYTAVHPSSLGA
ncbi:cation transporter [Neoaquamicrobium sediminum]|uniref:cation transporter n=1 Tax=Neoaquamicrobium sediminum TaxID=1849104 RepID=UPI00362350B1